MHRSLLDYLGDLMLSGVIAFVVVGALAWIWWAAHELRKPE